MFLKKIKNSKKLEQILINFIDVLRINILMIDTEGNPVLAPKTNGYGWKISSQTGILQNLGTTKFLQNFIKEGDYLKSTDVFGSQSFAIPIGFSQRNPIGYLIVGPVILNRRLDQTQYQVITDKIGLNFTEFQESFNEIRIVSFNSLKSTLDLLFELSQYALRLNDEEKPLPVTEKWSTSTDNSIFANLLDLAMALTQAECGSIMLFNQKTKELSIHVHKGMNSLQNLEDVRIKLGEGIAGLSAQDKTPFVINETNSSNRIKHLLKKPELKCAVVLPIIRENKEVLGVMSISTYQGNSRLAMHSEEMLNSLTMITSSTVGQVL